LKMDCFSQDLQIRKYMAVKMNGLLFDDVRFGKIKFLQFKNPVKSGFIKVNVNDGEFVGASIKNLPYKNVPIIGEPPEKRCQKGDMSKSEGQ